MARTRRQRQTTISTQTTNLRNDVEQEVNTESENTIIVNDPIEQDVVEVEDNSTDLDKENSTTQSSKSKPKLQIYKGLNDKVSIENWLKRYEMIAKYYKWKNDTKIVMLGNYLEDDALNWYIENSD